MVFHVSSFTSIDTQTRALKNDVFCLLGNSFLQLFLYAAVFWTLAVSAFSTHRIALAIWTAIALVYSVSGTNSGIYGGFGDDSAAEAMGAGYLLLSFVNVSEVCAGWS